MFKIEHSLLYTSRVAIFVMDGVPTYITGQLMSLTNLQNCLLLKNCKFMSFYTNINPWMCIKQSPGILLQTFLYNNFLENALFCDRTLLISIEFFKNLNT